MSVKLAEPSAKYKQSFMEAIAELEKDSSSADIVNNTASAVRSLGFSEYVKKQIDQSKGIGLQPGWVPATEWWLVDGSNFIGRASLRHKLNDNLLKYGGHIGYLIRTSERSKGYGHKILKLTLEKAKELGLKKVLLTCDETNAASRKIIEDNGGVMDNKLPQGDNKPDKLRFWIELKTKAEQ